MQPTVKKGTRIREEGGSASDRLQFHPKDLFTSLQRSPTKGVSIASGSQTKAIFAPESKQPFRVAWQGSLDPD